jgi:hypothetical protein
MAKLNATDHKMREILNQGQEPVWHMIRHDADDFRMRYLKALNWIHNAVDPAQLRVELETLLRDRKAEADVPLVQFMDGVTLGTLGKIAYCVNRGAQLAPTSMVRVRDALDVVRARQSAQPEQVEVMSQEFTPAGRVNHSYKACYSRLDNLRVMVCDGRAQLADVPELVTDILVAHGGDRTQVRKRLVEHYTQSVQEAQQDVVLKTWVKPLREILRVLGGDVKVVKPVKAAKVTKKVKADKKVATKPTKALVKKVAVKKASTRVVNVRAPRDAGKLTVAQQVRDLIVQHKSNTDAQGMVEIVMRELKLDKNRGRSVVKAFWDRVGA